MSLLPLGVWGMYRRSAGSGTFEEGISFFDTSLSIYPGLFSYIQVFFSYVQVAFVTGRMGNVSRQRDIWKETYQQDLPKRPSYSSYLSKRPNYFDTYQKDLVTLQIDLILRCDDNPHIRPVAKENWI